jgi:hypothetical protein
MTTKKSKEPYENNPFFIAVNGLTLLFNLARGMAIVLFVLSLFSFFANELSPAPTENDVNNYISTVKTWETSEWILAVSTVFIIGLALAMISALLSGVASYTSTQISQGKKVAIRTAFSEAFENLWSYLWMQIQIFIRVLLWSLLFIIPGIIMSIRYSLAGVVFYDDRKNLRGAAAIRESARITKGFFVTIFSANMLFNLITFGVATNIVSPGINAILYRQLSATGKKPPTHWLSWVTLIGIILLTILSIPILLSAERS